MQIAFECIAQTKQACLFQFLASYTRWFFSSLLLLLLFSSLLPEYHTYSKCFDCCYFFPSSSSSFVFLRSRSLLLLLKYKIIFILLLLLHLRWIQTNVFDLLLLLLYCCFSFYSTICYVLSVEIICAVLNHQMNCFMCGFFSSLHSFLAYHLVNWNLFFISAWVCSEQ